MDSETYLFFTLEWYNFGNYNFTQVIRLIVTNIYKDVSVFRCLIPSLFRRSVTPGETRRVIETRRLGYEDPYTLFIRGLNNWTNSVKTILKDNERRFTLGLTIREYLPIYLLSTYLSMYLLSIGRSNFIFV